MFVLTNILTTCQCSPETLSPKATGAQSKELHWSHAVSEETAAVHVLHQCKQRGKFVVPLLRELPTPNC